MEYYVFWYKGGLLGSVEKTPENLRYMQDRCTLFNKQVDISGTTHYSVTSPKKKKKIKQ